jgi:hypothetical protein
MALPGCASYESPPPAQATCSITVHDPGKSRQQLAIVNIDGARTQSHGGFGLSPPPTTFAVLPGHHTFSVRYIKGLAIGFMNIETEFEQAHSYTLYSDTEENRFTAWFVDDANGKRIEQKGKADWKKVLFGNMAD